jgi:hypothetical protein
MTVAFRGRQQAKTAILWLPRTEIEAGLDPDLRLGPVDRERHPVVFSFGRQTEVRPNLPVGPAMTYHEVLIAIPGVRPRKASDPTELFTWLPILWLDHRPAVALGRLAGLAKRHARIAWGTTIEVDDATVKGTFGALGPPRPALTHPTIARSSLPSLIGRPLIGRTVVGNWVSTTLDWGLEAATVRSCRATIEIGPGAPLASGRHEIEGIDDGALGGYELDHAWTVTVPRHLGAVARSLA